MSLFESPSPFSEAVADATSGGASPGAGGQLSASAKASHGEGKEPASARISIFAGTGFSLVAAPRCGSSGDLVATLAAPLPQNDPLKIVISGLAMNQIENLALYLQGVRETVDPFGSLPSSPVRLSAALRFAEECGGHLLSPVGGRATEIAVHYFLEVTRPHDEREFMWNVTLHREELEIWLLEFPSRVFMEAAFRALRFEGEGYVLPIQHLIDQNREEMSPLARAMMTLGLSRLPRSGALVFLYQKDAPDNLGREEDNNFLTERINAARRLLRSMQ